MDIRPRSSMRRVFAVSDIHGYGNLLQLLLGHANYIPGKDRLFLLGDYVNKGPDSVGTLELVRRLCEDGAVAIQGNNERKWLHHMANTTAGETVPNQTLANQAKTLGDEAVISQYRQWISGLSLWAEYEHYLFVHAGLRPGIPLEEQTPDDLTGIRQPFHQSPAWPDKLIVFGHTSTSQLGAVADQLWLRSGKLGIDTGAGNGHYLSLVELTAGLQWVVAVKAPFIVRQVHYRQWMCL